MKKAVDYVTKKELRDELEKFEERIVGKLDSKIKQLDEKLDSKIGQLDKKLDTKIRQLDEKIDSKIKQLDGKIGKLDEKLDSKIGQLDEKLDSKIKQLDNQNREYRDEILTKLDGIMGELQTMREENTIGMYQMREVKEELDDHEKRISKLESPQ